MKRIKYTLKGTLIVLVSVSVITQQLVWIQNYSFGCFFGFLLIYFLFGQFINIQLNKVLIL